MNCRTFHRQLEDYLEGGLDFPSRFGMERHAKQCFACGKVVSEAQDLKRKVRELRRVAAPANFEAGLLARIQADEARHRFWKFRSFVRLGFGPLRWRTIGVVSATAVAVAGAIILIYSGPWFKGSTPAQSDIVVQSTAPLAGENSDRSVSASGMLSGAAGAAATPISMGYTSGYQGPDPWAKPYVEPGDSGYIEYLIPVSGDRQLVMRLPRVIRIRYDQPSQEYFIRNISH
jgi:anti-sigma factor RsiW